MKNILLWLFSLIFTLAIAYYQRKTGPTYPVSAKYKIGEKEFKASLLRSYGGDGDAVIKIEIPDSSVRGELSYVRYKSYDEWQSFPMAREGNFLNAVIPHQPPAGKVVYKIRLFSGAEEINLTPEPVTIRFKGDVPGYFLIPHIILMFLAMLLSTRTGLEAILKRKNTFKLAAWTVVAFLLGGLVLGPIVQYYAFGAFWTGWPFGHDLTDNKTAVSFLLWLVALWKLKKNPENRVFPIIAAIGLLAIYLIPHSVLGSELDYTKLQTP